MDASHPFHHRPSWPKRLERLAFWGLRLGTYAVVACALVVFLDIGIKGGSVIFRGSWPFLNLPFLTESPETLNVFEWQGKTWQLGDRAYRAFVEANPGFDAHATPIETYVYSSGGILPNIVGTLILTTGAVAIALILGVFSAIYLNEYARQGSFIRMIRLAIVNLAGVPSIVFGLFGYGLFVIVGPLVQNTPPPAASFGFQLWPFDLYLNFVGWGVSVLAGWFTLAFMVLPIVITASEESLRAVPRGYREGALALGATRWQTIRLTVLPYAVPGMLTSSILAIARVAGETAPIMFTAAFVIRDEMPWDVSRFTDFFFQGVMALPYHIYVVSAKIPQNPYTEQVQYGTAFVFLFTVAAIAASSILLRARLRDKLKW